MIHNQNSERSDWRISYIAWFKKVSRAFWWFWCRWKALNISISTTPKASKSVENWPFWIMLCRIMRQAIHLWRECSRWRAQITSSHQRQSRQKRPIRDNILNRRSFIKSIIQTIIGSLKFIFRNHESPNCSLPFILQAYGDSDEWLPDQNMAMTRPYFASCTTVLMSLDCSLSRLSIKFLTTPISSQTWTYIASFIGLLSILAF